MSERTQGTRIQDPDIDKMHRSHLLMEKHFYFIFLASSKYIKLHIKEFMKHDMHYVITNLIELKTN